MARRSYTDEDKAKVFATLTGNSGNVKRTARDTGVAEQTVRDWKKKWESDGGVPATVASNLPAVVDEFVGEAKRVRNLALGLIEDKIIEGDAKVGELNAVVGTLTDKIHLIQGLPTSRNETQSTGPSPEEFGQALVQFVGRMLNAAEHREAEIVEAEYVEQAPEALPAAT